jgi:hypothetical protein
MVHFSTGPSGVATVYVPLPGWKFAGWEGVVVVAGEGLEWDKRGIVFE